MQKISSLVSLSSIYAVAVISFIITFAVFGNSLTNEFAVIDDLSGYIENETIRSIPQSIATFKIQEIVYALNYHFFQINPLPLRILALINHSIAGICIYFIIRSICNAKTAWISSLLFLVHPVTTESINWVSAQFYIVMAIFIYISLLCLIAYRNTGKQKYIYYIISIFALDIVLIRHAWVFILPFVLVTFDYFFLEAKKIQHFYKTYISWIIPLIVLFIIFNFSGQYTQRMLSRNESGKTLQNQQALLPVIQGYPYTVYNMVSLYLFPQELTVYYDGDKITSNTQVLMYSSFLLYIFSIIYFFKKDKRIAGFLVLLAVCILPVFSPKKITWFITERYLYTGTGFFTTLVAVLLISLEKKFNIKHLAYIAAVIIFFLYTYKTVTRNTEWKDPETLALATIRTSPYSVRPYNDLAGYYVLQHNYTDAKKYYVQALQVSSSLTAIRNLGHIFLEQTFDPTVQVLPYPADQIYNEAVRMIQSQEYFAAAFYLNEVLAKAPEHTDAHNRIAELFVLYGKPQTAKQYIYTLEEEQRANADTYYIAGYLAYSEKDYAVAREYINKVLELNTGHVAAQQLLQQLPTN